MATESSRIVEICRKTMSKVVLTWYVSETVIYTKQIFIDCPNSLWHALYK